VSISYFICIKDASGSECRWNEKRQVPLALWLDWIKAGPVRPALGEMDYMAGGVTPICASNTGRPPSAGESTCK
jgi:hypothetical protein